MLLLARLHGLAAPRGDGLRPELLDLLRQREERLASNRSVAEIYGDWQAGPDPLERLDLKLPESVVRFRARLPQAAGFGRIPAI